MCLLRHRMITFFSLVVVTSWGGRAESNGRPAATTAVAFDATSPRIFVGNTFGGLVSDDAGQSWRLICEQVLGTANQAIDSSYLTTSSGMLLISSAVGILTSRDG